MARRDHAVFVAEHMRMPADHLACHSLDDVAESECILLLRHAGVIDHLQQEIAEFILEVIKIAVGDGLGHLIGFLDGVGGDGRKVLLEVPGAAGHGRTQRLHHFDQA
jgi:hypothetical protein